MSAATEPNSARAYLGAELARLRKMAGLGGRALATRLGISQAKVSRIETGLGVPSIPEINAWADAVGADADARRHLLRLLEAAWSDVEPWRAAPAGRTHLQDEVREIEATARTVREFQPQLIPGLLQTPEYARRVFAVVDPHGQMDHDAAVTARLRRQEAFYEAFTVYTDRVEDLDTIVEIELRYASVTISDPRDVQLYLEDWQRWSAVAVYNDDAQHVLQNIAAELRTIP
jgi:transcriptional regulator with XRE-family HTH domain